MLVPVFSRMIPAYSVFQGAYAVALEKFYLKENLYPNTWKSLKKTDFPDKCRAHIKSQNLPWLLDADCDGCMKMAINNHLNDMRRKEKGLGHRKAKVICAFAVGVGCGRVANTARVFVG